MTVSRGIRNNNPGNIDYSQNTKWAGQLAHNPAIESRFCRFESPTYGIRALAKVLITYNKKYGINSIAGIIMRWAPATENNTKAYIDQVAKACGVDPFAEIDVLAHLRNLVPAIIKHENGQQPYPQDVIDAGIRLATGGK